MSEMNTNQLLLALDQQRQNLAANLSQKGVAASNTEGLVTLVPKVLDIVAGGGSGGGDLTYQHIISSRKSVSGQYVIFDDWATLIPDFDKVAAMLIYYDSNAVLCLKDDFANRTDISGGIMVPGQMFGVYNNTFNTWDVAQYKTGLQFLNTYGVKMTMNNSALSPGTKEAMFLIQEGS